MSDTMTGKATQRVRQLEKEGKKGEEIARVLLQEGFAIDEADAAFSALRYVVKIAVFMEGVYELHVSNTPLDGFAAIVAAFEPRALPSVVWQTDEERRSNEAAS